MTQKEELIARYCGEPTVERRNAVVDAYRPMCVRAARKFKRARNDRADLEQVAAVGLIKAASNYKAGMTTPFHVYAWIVIVGELMHYTRDFERIVRLPRALYQLERRYAHAWERFVAAHQREPTGAELGAALGCDVRTIAELRVARAGDAVSLALTNSGEADAPGSRATHQLALDERIALKLAVGELDERERTIVLGTFGAGLTQMELARRLGLSQSHVSKLLSRALDRLGRRVA